MPGVSLLTSLGSSFAAGPGIEPLADVSAQRSARNYPHQLAERIGARLVDLTVSGATTANLIDIPQTKDDGTVFAPQTDAIPPETDLITITAGGNDLRFLGTIIFLGLSRVAPDSEFVSEHGDLFGGGIPQPSDGDVARVVTGLVGVIEKARARAPAARIVLVDYLTVVAERSADRTPFTADEIRQFTLIQDAVRRIFSEAASQTGVELVRASAISEQHALGAEDCWLQPLTAPGALHPTAAGMTAVAEEIERRLRDERSA